MRNGRLVQIGYDITFSFCVISSYTVAGNGLKKTRLLRPKESEEDRALKFISNGSLTMIVEQGQKLRTFVTENEIEAAFIMSGTGDLTRANIQFPNKMVGQCHRFDSLTFHVICLYTNR